jgi:diaminopimelate epimerase
MSGGKTVGITAVSMGNPHAVQVVADVDTAPVAEQGPLIESPPALPAPGQCRFHAGGGSHAIRLRVFERGAGETLACGTGACAAVVAGIRRGLLDSPVRVATRGGELSIAWAGPGQAVMMTGPATTVFSAERPPIAPAWCAPCTRTSAAPLPYRMSACACGAWAEAAAPKATR